MFFRIDETVISLIEHQVLPANFSICIDELFRARRLGKHLIYCKPAHLEKIEALPGISEATKLTIRKIKSLQRFKKTIFESMTTYVNVISTPNTIRTSVEQGKTIIEISIDNFANGDFLEPTVLLAENITDCELFQHIAKIKNHNSTNLQNLRHNAHFISGGGSQTPRQFEINSTQNRLSLCIVDGDLEYENATLGTNTAAPIMQLHTDSPKPHSFPVILNCYSVENLIPSDLIKKSTKQEINQSDYLREIESLQTQDYWPYIPLKIGKSCTNFVSSDAKGAYWSQHRAGFTPKQQSCLTWAGGNCSPGCIVLDKMPDKTARIVAEYLSSTIKNGQFREIAKSISTLPSEINKLWTEVSIHVNSWACSGDRITAF
ncbi:hypothetical protein [Pseudomonas batumici]|uniref:Uncharacterized protein n=1 Tax=Pseudomonas batumici TaxID=226910 RepID=A0A0C2IF57_9PSED|nr:hypothetical protein [Pseudomonas batumici]KIH83557.1 hypothetical protein UCMB321_2683 [Pseudomonas batumici]